MSLVQQEPDAKDDPAKTGQGKSADQAHDPQPSVLPTTTPPDPPNTPASDYHTGPKPYDGHKVITSTVEIVGLAVLIVYTFFSCLQWFQIRWTNRLTREALNANNTSLQQTLDKMQGQIEATDRLYGEAQRQTAELGKQTREAHASAVSAAMQAKEAAKQTALNEEVSESQRARVIVDLLRVEHPITFSKGGMSFAFTVSLKNVGDFPATNPVMRYKVIFVQWGDSYFRDPPRKQAELCDAAPTSGERLGPLNQIPIGKGEATTREVNFGVPLTDADLVKWPPKAENPTLVVAPLVVGCVDYQSGAIPKNHQAGFIFLIETDWRLGLHAGGMVPLGMTIPADRVAVGKYVFEQGKQY